MKRVIVCGLGVAVLGFVPVYSMETVQFSEKARKELVAAISGDNYVKVCDLIKDGRSFLDDAFLKKEIIPLLFDKESRVRGLAFYALFGLSRHGELSSEVLQCCEKSALDDGLKSFLIEEDVPCNVKIKVLGDHENKELKTNVGLAIAISSEGSVSRPLHRDLLDEHYFIIAGKIDVAMRKSGEKEWTITHGKPGDYICIPRKVHVQFKNAGKGTLTFLVPTTPSYGSIARQTVVETLLDPKDGCWDKEGKIIGKVK